MKKVIFENSEMSLAVAAHKIGATPDEIRAYAKDNDMDINKALISYKEKNTDHNGEIIRHVPRRWKNIVCHGEIYANATQLALTYECSPTTLIRRLEQGISPEMAVDKTIRIESTKVYHIIRPDEKMYGWDDSKGGYVAPNGKTYPSIASMCRDYGVQTGTVKYRLTNGATLKEALQKGSGFKAKEKSFSRYGRKRNGKYHMMKHGKTEYKSFDSMVSRTQINPTFYKILCNYGLDAEKWIADHPEIIEEIRTRAYKNYMDEMAAEPTMFRMMIKTGLTAKDAAEAYHKTKKRSIPKEAFGYNAIKGCYVAPDGKEFTNKHTLCEHYGISYRQVLRGLDAGLSLEKVLMS